MSFPQKKFREIVFQLLYSYDLGLSSEEEMVPFLMRELSVTKKIVRTAMVKAKAILDSLPEVDSIIGKTCISYDFSRIQSVERNVLRLGAYELLFDTAIPPKVAISEAIRLARKYGGPPSANFVNAVMDSLYKSKDGQSVNASEITQTYETLIQSEKTNQETAQMPRESDENQKELSE